MFQSTHPRGVRLFYFLALGAPLAGFNPRTHGGCDSFLRFVIFVVTFQSTHPRGVRRDGCNLGSTFLHVSIHAPTGGATHGGGTPDAYFVVSIHAPTGGATHWMPLPQAPKSCFNPRTHGGCDKNWIMTRKEKKVSIHAPTGGATQRPASKRWNHGKFQSTHPRGVRHVLYHIFRKMFIVSIHAPTGGATVAVAVAVADRKFQSTHPRGVRRGSRVTCW